jgi:hypothetical protein
MTNPIETAAKLLQQQREINILRKKLQRVKTFVNTYRSITPGNYQAVNELRAAVVDIIDNAYNEGEGKTDGAAS